MIRQVLLVFSLMELLIYSVPSGECSGMFFWKVVCKELLVGTTALAVTVIVRILILFTFVAGNPQPNLHLPLAFLGG